MINRRVGVFGGSFDPIHNGHVHLALALKEAAELDEVFFVPALVSPFKTDNPPKASGKDRLAMLRLALDGVEGLSVCEEELLRAEPSHTVDTLETLSRHSSDELYLLMAEDTFRGFSQWKEPDRILRLAQILVGNLGGSAADPRATFISVPRLEISSTWVRKRLKEKLYCGHLLPGSVCQYIEKHGLYAN